MLKMKKFQKYTHTLRFDFVFIQFFKHNFVEVSKPDFAFDINQRVALHFSVTSNTHMKHTMKHLIILNYLE